MYVVAHVDYVRAVTVRPISPELTELTAEWLFPAETLAAPGFDLSNVVDFAATVIREDGDASEMNQRGRDTLIGSVPAPVPADLLHQAEKLDATGDAANRRAIVAASLSGASLLTGITLLAVDAHRRRKHRHLALVPVTGPTFGFRLRLEF